MGNVGIVARVFDDCGLRRFVDKRKVQQLEFRMSILRQIDLNRACAFSGQNEPKRRLGRRSRTGTGGPTAFQSDIVGLA